LRALAGGDADAARSAAAGAVELLGRVDCRAHRARALHVLGRALAVTDPAEAVQALRTAGQTFAACGAPWRQARTLDALSGLGGAGRRAGWAVRGSSALTRREREVARMAAEGHSAREIAERLFISKRTVESHLGKVYAKLGVGSKPRLAARAEEFPL
jgi:DNA-binding CsgD family transcriptional regulator